LAVPLTFRGGVSGVVEAINKISGTFDEHDLETLETIAGSAALAIENARLYQAALDERGRLQALVESSRDGIILGGMNGRILVINTPAIEFLRLPGQASDWLGRSIFDVLRFMRRYAPSVVRATIAEMHRIAKAQELTGEDEYEVPPRTIHWLNLPVRAGAAPLARLMVLRDVTQERAAGTLREDVTRMMVHDLRNPVGTILTALELLATDTAPILSFEQRRTLDIARTGAQRMLDLVNSILDVSQLESGQISLDWARIQLDQLVGETLRTQLPAIKAKNLTLETDVPSTLPSAWVDADLVGRVLQNLMSNAVKFTPVGGAIRVTARVEKNDKLLVSISDTGSGIPLEIQGRLFQKFVRGRQVGRGSGLGLAFCKLAMEAHGERIWVDSTSERGTTVTFSLAMAPGA
jgi:two-component system, NtrC family, sensor histidine kinase KinB